MRQLRRKVSIVFQDPASSLNPRATVGSNITSPLRWNGIERDPGKLEATGRELLERVKLPGDWVHRFPHELSGGQRQRVSIARAIAMRPRLMVADEPTSALDVTVQATIIGLLKQLQRDFGFACLFISHDLSLVQQLSQRVVVLRDGKVVEQGSTSTVLGNPADDYTRALVAAAPVPDPELQRQRRLAPAMRFRRCRWRIDTMMSRATSRPNCSALYRGGWTAVAAERGQVMLNGRA